MTQGLTKLRTCKGCKQEVPTDMFATQTRCKECGPCIRTPRYKQLGMTRKEFSNLTIRVNRHRLNVTQFLTLLETQKGKCAICGAYHNLKLRIDHCHKSSQARKLLCNKCNAGLGQFNDDPELMRKAIKYLEEHKNLLVLQ